MDYKKLFAGVEYYNKHYPHWTNSYRRLRRRGDEYWLHLERLSENQMGHEIVRFLNDWLCRVDRRSTSSLKEVLDSLPSYYTALKSERIENIQFNELKVINGRHLTNSEVIEKIMDKFLTVRPKFGSIAASKLMHMAVPRLFVMWDTGIKDKYGIPTYHAANHARHYVRFLKMMQRQIRHAINSYSEARDINRQAALHQIRLEDNNFLPRMVDKFNFAMRDGALNICPECFRTT